MKHVRSVARVVLALIAAGCAAQGFTSGLSGREPLEPAYLGCLVVAFTVAAAAFSLARDD